ncbi:MAG TPA: cytochrome c [Phenylobacterium sp.]|nr:cytochrome c [Phenylobacterium sp.]
MALKTMLWALALTAGLAAGAALAQDPAAATPGGKAVLVRQAHYKELNGAFRAINEQLRAEAPDKAAIASNAGKMKALADDLPGWFPKGSGPEAGVKTAAKAEIWTDAEGFAAAATKLQAETAKLSDVTAGADLEALKAQARATGAACKACHDKYRTS